MKAVFVDHNVFVSHYKEERFLNMSLQISIEQPIEYKLPNSNWFNRLDMLESFTVNRYIVKLFCFSDLVDSLMEV